MRVFLILVLLSHGSIHLMGFAKAFNPLSMPRLSLDIGKPAGLLWLLASLLFLSGAALFLFKKDSWWMLAGPALILSQILMIFAWKDAKFGTLVNLVILLPVLVSYLDARPDSFLNRYQAEARKGLLRQTGTTLVTEVDIRHLPRAVQNYLRFTGSVGRQKVQNFRALFTGTMRFEKKDGWINITSRQYNFFDDPTRDFYIRSKMFGIPFDGLHLYVGNNATMQIKVASLVQVVDARGAKMTRGETVTLLNDMCILAPATLIDRNIEWETISPLVVKARFTNKGIVVTAVLYFNEQGALINFTSDDRYWSKDGKTYKSYQWSTPIRDYRDGDGRKIMGYGEASWKTPEGEYTYARFNLQEIEYNCREFK